MKTTKITNSHIGKNNNNNPLYNIKTLDVHRDIKRQYIGTQPVSLSFVLY